MHVLTKLTSNPSPGGFGLVSGHPHVLDLTTRLEESEHLFSRHVASQVADIDGASYLLDLGGVSERGAVSWDSWGAGVGSIIMRGAVSWESWGGGGGGQVWVVYTFIECLVSTERVSIIMFV